MSLEYQLRLIKSRGDRFEELKEAYSRKDYSKTGFAINDFLNLSRGIYSNSSEGPEIPESLIEKAVWVLKETEKLGFSFMKSPQDEQKTENLERYLKFFSECE